VHLPPPRRAFSLRVVIGKNMNKRKYPIKEIKLCHLSYILMVFLWMCVDSSPTYSDRRSLDQER
jgi:hypothetical protein